MTAARPEYDLIVVGGGPAGAAAAIAASQLKLHTLLIDAPGAAAPPACTGWAGPAAVQLCRDCGVAPEALGETFTGLRLWSWDGSKSTEVKDAALAGCIVNPAELSQALRSAARDRGAEILAPAAAAQLSAREDQTVVQLADGRKLSGQVVVVATGAASDLARRAAFSPGTPDTRAPLGAVVTLTSRQRLDCGLDVVIGATRAFKLLTIARAGSHIFAALLTHDHATPAVAQLTAVLDSLRHAGVLPNDCVGQPRAAAGLAGSALEYESHVAKRGLLAGDAGGFVAAFSNDGLYPALRSGWLAAETAARALQAPVLQDELATFSAVWRSDLADYLRMPNTDLGLLLPMVFSNAQMSRRVARAFLLGQGL